jgi:hypothetical protein
MIEKEFVPPEESLTLKELGFDEPCFTTYDHEERLRNPFDYSKSEYGEDAQYIEDTKEWIYNSELTIENFNGPSYLYRQFIAAPTFSQAFKWFREKHKLLCLPEPTGSWRYSCHYRSEDRDGKHWVGYLRGKNNNVMFFNTYEEAELACLRKLIEIVKQ